MQIKTKNKVALFLLVFLVSSTRLGKADVGIFPVHPHGGTIDTSDPNTKVSMMYEEVTLTYGVPKNEYIDDILLGRIMPVSVVAKFVMRNNGDEDEKLKVYFPQSDYAFVGGWSEDKIKNFKVNGLLIDESEAVQIPYDHPDYKEITVYQWEETFKARSTKEIVIEYDTKSQNNFQIFPLTYVLGTGRNWYGPIGRGVIAFVMPYDLQPYSVTSDVRMLNKFKLPYSLNKNKITVAFSNYEPDEREAIMLGVYDFEIVNEIERIKKLNTNIANTLSLAENFKKLTAGPKCSLCSGGETLTNALNYYRKALDLAVTKGDLDRILFSYSGIPGEYTLKINDLLSYLTFDNCATEDLACVYQIYTSREKMDATVFRLNWITKSVDHKDFLLAYAKKVEMYNPQLAEGIRSYTSRAPDMIAYGNSLNGQVRNDKNKDAEVTTEEQKLLESEATNQPPIKDQELLKDGVIKKSKTEILNYLIERVAAPIAALVSMMVFVLFGYMAKRKRNNLNNRKNKSPDNMGIKENEQTRL